MEEDSIKQLSNQADTRKTEKKANNNKGHTILSAREAQVLSLAADGLNNKQVAEKLDLTENTIDSHCRNIFRGLSAKNMKQAIAIGFRKKIIQ